MEDAAEIVVDGLQYSNWSEAIFRQMRRGGVTAVHATIAYHENFRETVAISSAGTAGSSVSRS
jgi:membrane dipeptidase